MDTKTGKQVEFLDLMERAGHARSARRNFIRMCGGAAVMSGGLSLLAAFAVPVLLARNGLTTRLSVLEAQRLFMSAKAEHERLNGQRATGQRSLAEAEARIVEARSAAVDEARQEAARAVEADRHLRDEHEVGVGGRQRRVAGDEPGVPPHQLHEADPVRERGRLDVGRADRLGQPHRVDR